MMRTIVTGLLLAALPPVAAMADEIDETFDVVPGGTLYIDLDCGSVEVTSQEADQVRIEAHATGWAAWSVDFDLWREGNNVHLSGETNGWGSWLLWPFGAPRVHVRAWVPRDYSLASRTAGGRVALANLSGRIAAETGGGSMTLRGATGMVDLFTSGGTVEIQKVNGTLNAETSGGSVTIADVTGDVRTRTSGGRIQITRASGEVEAATSGGNISVSFTGAPAGSLETSGGRIEVRFPETAGANLDAQTSGGRVEVAQRHSLRSGEDDPRHVVGQINGGGAALRLRTSGGNIAVGAL